MKRSAILSWKDRSYVLGALDEKDITVLKDWVLQQHFGRLDDRIPCQIVKKVLNVKQGDSISGPWEPA